MYAESTVALVTKESEKERQTMPAGVPLPSPAGAGHLRERGGEPAGAAERGKNFTMGVVLGGRGEGGGLNSRKNKES